MLTEDELDQLEDATYKIYSFVRTLVCLNEDIGDEHTISCNRTILAYLLPEIDKITAMF